MSRGYLAALWLLSGAPVGVALALLPPAALLWCFAIFIVLDEAHNLAPIFLAWSRGEFRRRIIYCQPLKFVVMPGVILTLLLAIGGATELGWTSYAYSSNVYALTDWTNLLPVAMWIYWPWKIYHFGMQNFGVMQLLRIGQRRLNMVLCLVATFFGMAVVPALTNSREAFLLTLAAFSVNHWVTDLGLSARIMGRRWWLIIGALLAFGMGGFAWLVPTSDGMMMRVIPLAICLRLAAGFVHFLYSRWVWQSENREILCRGSGFTV